MANPFVDLYLWIIGRSALAVPELSATLTYIAESTEETLMKEINKVETHIAREARKKKYATSTPSPASWVDNPEALLVFNDLNACQGFLKLLQHFTKDRHGNSPLTISEAYQLALTYLANSSLSPHLKSTKGQTLFSNFLAATGESAIQWFESHQQFSKMLSPGISFLVSAHREEQQAKNITMEIAKRQQRLLNLLMFEDHVVGILPFFQKALDDVVEFATLLLTALQKGVTGEQIVSSSLLDQFIAFHFPHSGKENNEIQQLREILEKFPETYFLTEEVNNLLANYLSSPNFKESVTTPISYTASEKNFNNLADLLGEPFLMFCIEEATRGSKTEQTLWVEAYLNSMAHADLGNIINKAGRNNHEPILGFIAHLLSAATIENLIANHEGAIFCLAAYLPPKILATFSETTSLQHYLRQLKKTGANDHDLISQLTRLLATPMHEDAQALVFAEVVNVFIENPSFEEDNRLMRTLRSAAKKPKNRDILSLKAAELLHNWHSTLQELALKKDHLGMEDLWIEYNKPFAALKKLGDQTDFPDNKYELYSHLVTTLADRTDFQLADFLDGICVAEEPASGMSTKERALLEIVSTVDNEHIRQSAIYLLENNFRKNHNWWREKLGSSDDSLLNLAAERGNLGLIQFFFSPEKAPIYEIDELATEEALEAAVKKGKFSIVQHLCGLESTNRPSTVALGRALQLATHTKQWGIVDFLFNLKENPPDLAATKKALEYAVGIGQLEMVKIVSKLPADKKPEARVFAEALYTAIEGDSLPIVKFLCDPTTMPYRFAPAVIKKAFTMAVDGGWRTKEFLPFFGNLDTDNRLTGEDIGIILTNVVQEKDWSKVNRLAQATFNIGPDVRALDFALRSAADAHQWDTVGYLATVPYTNKPTQEAIAKVFQRAIDHYQFVGLISFCYNSPNVNLSSEVINSTLDYAVQKKAWHAVEQLIIARAHLSSAVLSFTLKCAAEAREWFIVKSLDDSSRGNKPDQEAIRIILREAVAADRFDIIEFICFSENLQPDSEIIGRTLILALAIRSWQIVKFLCGLPSDIKPGKETIAQALFDAIEQDQLSIVQLICGLTTENKPDGATMATALGVAINCNHLQVVKFLYAIYPEANSKIASMLPELTKESTVKFLCNLTMRTEPGLDKEALQITLKTWKGQKDLSEFLKEAILYKELCEAIASLKEYGANLKQKSTRSHDGDYAITQANDLFSLVKEFRKLQLENPLDEMLATIRSDFKTKLQESYKKMGKHQQIWKPILANIAIAATGIGLLLLLGKLLMTRTGFFSHTSRQAKLKQVEVIFNELEKHTSP